VEKQLILSISPIEQKYYLATDFKDIPQAIREDLLEVSARLAEKIGNVICVGFYPNGNLYIEEMSEETIFRDEIGSELEIKQFQMKNKELLRSLKMWYLIYRTEEGKILKEILLLQQKLTSAEEIGKVIEKKYGASAYDFAMQMLEDNLD
jgi:hypothetical protein